MVDAIVRIVREEGPFALYRGIGPALSLVSNGALQFMFYEELKRMVRAFCCFFFSPRVFSGVQQICIKMERRAII
jgi:hypothetical protein